MSTQNDRLDSIKSELNDLLEVRIGHLLGVVRAAQTLTRQIVDTEAEIRLQTRLQEELAAELGPLNDTASELASGNDELRARVAAARSSVDRMRSLREELMSNLSNLKGGTDDE